MKRFLILILVLLIVPFALKLFVFNSEDKSVSDKDYKEAFLSRYRVFTVEIPEKVDFSGERVPTEIFDVRERLDRELLVNTYWQSNTILMIKRAKRYFPMIEKILKAEGVPDDFKYLALIESGFTNVVSPSGAAGFWQFIKDTGIKYGMEINEEVDERYNLEKATKGACLYLKESFNKYGSWTIAAASYNLGISGVEKQIGRQKVNNFYDLLLNEETSRYIFRILALKIIYEKPSDYGFVLREKDMYKPIPTDKVKVDSSIVDLVDFAMKNKINYKTLKLFNPWLRDIYLKNKERKTYYVLIPKEVNGEWRIEN